MLLAGKKTLGELKIARFDGTRKIVVKLKSAKLKRGKRYVLSAGGTDAQDRAVSASIRLKVKK